MHPRLSVSQISSWNWSLDEDLAFYEKAGISAVGLAMRKLDGVDPAELAARLQDAGIRVTNLQAASPYQLDQPEHWSTQRDEMGRIMDTAIALQPEVVVLTTGSAGSLPWERAADAFEEAMHGSVAEAARENLMLAIEHTHSLRTDVGFVHTLHDAIDLAWRLDVGACMEINACWAERNLAGTIAHGVLAIQVVQVSDYAIGTTSTPDRLVPGEGDIPLRRILDQLLDAGYTGRFELELVGPHIEEEGYESAILRSIDYLTELLDDLLPPPEDELDGDRATETTTDGDATEVAAHNVDLDLEAGAT